MAKAILVMDMPTSCSRCFLRFERVVGCKQTPCVSCTMFPTMVIKNDSTRQEYCPLREVPQKKEVKQYSGNGVIGINTMSNSRYSEGYNACIDEILGGGE
jgi:hypothetical protein